MWKTSMEIMKNWLYDHCGILQTLGCNYELGHSEACGVIAFIMTLLLLVASFLLWHKAVAWGYCLISVANRVAEFNVSIPSFSLWKWKKNQRYVNSIFGIYKIGMSLKEKNSLYDGTAKIGSQEHFYLKHF